MADGQILEDAADLLEDVPPGWHPQGLLAGLPAMNAAAGQSTLGALMTPEQIADVDWGDDAPDCDPGFTMRLPGPDPDPGFDAPWTASGQDTGIMPLGNLPASSPTVDEIHPAAKVERF